ncbi:enoyl-CoA hydratase-related protein [Acetobacter sp.]|jgi:enoyl-CoA hydratase|uniref:enoyl-CoA hydratase-related protein n=1 Tax=Acetobacter sp. TaxID=440 RepID=UPI0025C12916|nr:enoyl-CoA hydratase-related protein [Acetobacter sp.]MCH4089788.1 enoyl-CoA hydratase-related protein [Acetobacter sp.]MCI1298484.1 enoyl-CoA hydratase-related protein [Acetobacter sp.]
MTETFILRQQHGHIGQITLNRPQKLNALCLPMLAELVAAIQDYDATPDVRAIVICGQSRAFAAGADVGTLAESGAIALYTSGFSEHWDQIAACQTPIIAAVQGYALGGGLELLMACDIIIAAPDAVFGLPETTLGIIPGAGATQRLTRTVGKSLAMEMVLAGRRLNATEACAQGLVSQITEDGETVSTAIAVAGRIAQAGPLATHMAKAALLASYDMPLTAGIKYERTLSALVAASEDRKAGLAALGSRTKPTFHGR